MRYPVGCPRKVRVLEQQARLSHLALPEMLRLFRFSGLASCRYRHGVSEGYPDRGPVTVSVVAGRIRSGLEKRHVKISTDRGRCGPVAGRNFARDGKNPRGPGAHGNPSPSRYQRDHVAPDRSEPLLSLVRPVLWLFRSAPRLIRLLCCAAFQSRLHLRSRETGGLAIGLGLRLSQQLRQLGDICRDPSRAGSNSMRCFASIAKVQAADRRASTAL